MREHGAKLAREEVILALDDDIIAAPGMVSGHARWHKMGSDLVVLGYMPVAPPPPGGRWSAATRLYAEDYERACDAFDQAPDSALTGLWGGNFSVRREHWRRADELERVRLDSMHTDREFGLRLHQLGLRGRFDRRLRAFHHDERSATRLAEAARGSAVATVRFEQAGVVPPDPPIRSRYARWIVVGVLAPHGSPRVWGHDAPRAQSGSPVSRTPGTSGRVSTR